MNRARFDLSHQRQPEMLPQHRRHQEGHRGLLGFLSSACGDGGRQPLPALQEEVRQGVAEAGEDPDVWKGKQTENLYWQRGVRMEVFSNRCGSPTPICPRPRRRRPPPSRASGRRRGSPPPCPPPPRAPGTPPRRGGSGRGRGGPERGRTADGGVSARTEWRFVLTGLSQGSQLFT